MRMLKPLSSVLLVVSLLLSFSCVCFADMPVFDKAPSSVTTLEEVTLPSEEVTLPSEDIPQADTPILDNAPAEELPPTESEPPYEYISVDYTSSLNDIHERLQSIEMMSQIFIYGVIPILSAVIIVYKLLGAFKNYFCP